MIIYIDTDGVIADFDKGVIDYLMVSTKTMQEDHPNFVNALCAITKFGFFRELPPMDDADVLMAGLSDFQRKILTCHGSHRNKKAVAYQKHQWIDTHFPGHEVISVDSGLHKAWWASEKAVLIDDRKKNVDAFRDAGGRAILHENALQSLYELSDMLDI